MIPCVPQVKSQQSDNMPKQSHARHPSTGEILERNETNYKRRFFVES